MLFRCLWRNVRTSCHKHFVVVSRHQQTLPLTTSDKCHNFPRFGGTVLITPILSQRWQHAIKPDIGSESRFLPTPPAILHPTPTFGRSRRNVAMTFGVEKSEWCGYPTVKQFWSYVYFFDRIDERDGQTDGQTDTAWWHRPRLHSTAPQ